MVLTVLLHSEIKEKLTFKGKTSVVFLGDKPGEEQKQNKKKLGEKFTGSKELAFDTVKTVAVFGCA